MNLPDQLICEYIDRMATADVSFALYRLPWTDEPVLVLQDETEPIVMADLHQLNGKSGFILAPFDLDSELPVICIRPDYVAHTWNSVSRTVLLFKSSHHQLGHIACPNAEEQPNESSLKQEQKTYIETFNRFIVPLREKRFRKLVLSRCSNRTLPDGFSPIKTFVRACNSYPRMMISFCHTPVTGTWIGCTPEIILSGHDKAWHTVALAGTMKIENNHIPTLWSEKNREEQAFVSEYIRTTLKRFGNKITEKAPYTARAGQLVHLKTDFRFSLKDTMRIGDALSELHPTPAVCGLPKDEARKFITENEGYKRQYYSGVIGWLDPQGDTHLYVNLRCMHIHRNTATLYAGGGILPLSEAHAEWDETVEKMNTMLPIISE